MVWMYAVMPPGSRAHSTMAKPLIRPSCSAIQVAALALCTSRRICPRPKRKADSKQSSSIT
jgi:hypothetical protein